MLGYFAPGTFGTYSIDDGSGAIDIRVTSGILVGWHDEFSDFMSVEKTVWDINGKESVVKSNLQMNRHNFFCYDQSFATDNKILFNMSDDYSLAVVLEDKKLSLYKFDGCAYRETAVYHLDNESLEECTADNEQKLYCVAENSSVFSIDLKTGHKDESFYESSIVPGLVIIGCDFKNAEMSSYVYDLLKRHGGIV